MEIIDEFDNCKLKFHENIHISSVVQVLLSHYANLSDNDQLVPNTLSKMNDCSVFWIEQNETVIGGICFRINEEMSAVEIESIFYNNYSEFEDLFIRCFKHLELYTKSKGYSYVGICFETSNENYLTMIEKVGMKKKYYISCRYVDKIM